MRFRRSIPADFKDKLFGAFDQVMLEKLSGGWGHTHGERVPNSLRGNIRDGKVETYRFIDNVWTFDLRSAAFSGGCFNQGPRMAMSVDKVRIVAVDAKMFLSKDLAGGTDAAVATAAPALRNGSAPISVAAARELPASEESATLFDDEEDDDDFEDTEQLAQLDGAADIHTRYVSVSALARAGACPILSGRLTGSARSTGEGTSHENRGTGSSAALPGGGEGEASWAAQKEPSQQQSQQQSQHSQQQQQQQQQQHWLPQFDGDFVDDDDGDWEDAAPEEDEDLDSRSKRQRLAGAGDDEELNSDDDDDDGLVQPEGAMTVGAEQRAWQTNQILAQYIKVKRTRQKWTCKLKAGIARLNGRDYAFTSCDAELVYG